MCKAQPSLLPMMKTVLKTLIFTIALSSLHLNGQDESDNVIQLDGSVEVSRVGDSWLRFSVPFLVKSHPDMENLAGGKPSSMEELFNPEFIDNLVIKLTICYRNEFRRKYIRGDKNDIQFNDYYSALVEVQILKIDRSKKTAVFLLPALIAERDDYAGSTPKLTGYVIEFSRNGQTFDVSDTVAFERYTNPDTLEKFKTEALSKSISNEGILIPGHLIDPSYLRSLGPVSWGP